MNLTQQDTKREPVEWMPILRAMTVLNMSQQGVLGYVRLGRLQAQLCGNRWWIKAKGVRWLAKQLAARRQRVAV